MTKQLYKLKIKKDVVYLGRRCIVIECDRSPMFKHCPELKSSLSKFLTEPWCNGYIELKENETNRDYDDFDIKSDELTFKGKLNHIPELNGSKETFIGFDSAHLWNDDNPKSKTADYVAKTCKKIVMELIK